MLCWLLSGKVLLKCHNLKQSLDFVVNNCYNVVLQLSLITNGPGRLGCGMQPSSSPIWMHSWSSGTVHSLWPPQSKRQSQSALGQPRWRGQCSHRHSRPAEEVCSCCCANIQDSRYVGCSSSGELWVALAKLQRWKRKERGAGEGIQGSSASWGIQEDSTQISQKATLLLSVGQVAIPEVLLIKTL